MAKAYTKEEIENALSTARVGVGTAAREMWRDERILINTTIASYEQIVRATLGMEEANGDDYRP